MPNRRKRQRRNIQFKLAEFERLNGICPFCQKPMTLERDQPNTITIDHLVARQRGGTNGIANRHVMCFTCNLRKGTHSLSHFLCNRLWEVSGVK